MSVEVAKRSGSEGRRKETNDGRSGMHVKRVGCPPDAGQNNDASCSQCMVHPAACFTPGDS